jgi:hypothetical protein
MPALRDHSRVGNGDHSDADIAAPYDKEIEGEQPGFEGRKLDAREMARFLRIDPGQVRIKNRGI